MMTNPNEIESLHSALGEAERYAKELEARLAEREWRPIETAPNTGHILVIGGPHEAVTIRPADGDFWRREKVGPTHWMPLPEPPST